MKAQQYQVWVRSRGANPWGANLNVPCKDAIFSTREEAQAYANSGISSPFNSYYIKEI